MQVLLILLVLTIPSPTHKKKTIDWTKAQDQRAAMYAVHHLGRAIDNWKAKRAKFPKLKKRGCKHSYTTDAQAARMEGQRLKLPKIRWVKTFEELRFRGKIVSISDRQYLCSHCGTSIDRDVNAAINLRTPAAGHAES